MRYKWRKLNDSDFITLICTTIRCGYFACYRRMSLDQSFKELELPPLEILSAILVSLETTGRVLALAFRWSLVPHMLPGLITLGLIKCPVHFILT